LRRREPLLVEAGTGVGKTLAYLVPLVALAAEGRRAVVSTHTRALQSQILSQDLPRLQPLLGERRFRLLMGRRNYLCLRQQRAFLTRPVEDLADGLRTAALRLWLAVTDEGLREELAGHPLLQPCLGELFDAADLCLPGLCWEGDRCHVQRARRRAREADILVVNHALLLHDLRQGRTLLGDYDALVVRSETRVTAQVIQAGRRLQVIGRAGVGVDNIDRTAASELGIWVCNTPGYASIGVAEHALTLALSVARQIITNDRQIRAGAWSRGWLCRRGPLARTRRGARYDRVRARQRTIV